MWKVFVIAPGPSSWCHCNTEHWGQHFLPALQTQVVRGQEPTEKVGSVQCLGQLQLDSPSYYRDGELLPGTAGLDSGSEAPPCTGRS